MASSTDECVFVEVAIRGRRAKIESLICANCIMELSVKLCHLHYFSYTGK
ncbi:hypothetical protein IC582_009575 [Cucumis melo]